jgi:hypothetical protein
MGSKSATGGAGDPERAASAIAGLSNVHEPRTRSHPADASLSGGSAVDCASLEVPESRVVGLTPTVWTDPALVRPTSCFSSAFDSKVADGPFPAPWTPAETLNHERRNHDDGRA